MSKGMKISMLVLGLGLAFAIGLGVNHGKESTAKGREEDTPAPVPIPLPPPPKQLNLAYGFSKGVFFDHDLFLTNTCGEDLSDVHLAITFIGEDKSPEVDRYWATWPLGVRQTVSIPVDRVSNVQRITVRGKAEEGVVIADLAPKE